jgi:uncharacterized integral membrane protein
LSRLIDLIIKAECWVAGVGFLLLAILAILALINQMWVQLGIFIGFFAVGVVIMLMSAHVQLVIDELQSVLKACK